MFENQTYEAIMADAIARAPEGIDTRQGSIYFDAISGMALRLAKYYTDLDLIRTMATINTATGDALDTKGAEYGLERHPAIAVQYRAEFEGGPPKEGDRFYYDLNYFVFKYVDESGEQTAVFEAEIPGEDENDILPGTPAVPVLTDLSLESATFGEVFLRGADIEDDSSFRTRIYEKIGTPAENGNRQHYKSWCESRDGVGRARIFPLWQGENTVKAVLIDPNGYPVNSQVVEDVQNYIDPCGKQMTIEVDGKVYNYGDGLGNGVANIGAHFTAVEANRLNINVSFRVTEKQESVSYEQIKRQTGQLIQDYLKELVMQTNDGDRIVVRFNNIGALLSDVEGLIDYTDFAVNGSNVNLYPTDDEVPVLGEVDVTW